MWRPISPRTPAVIAVATALLGCGAGAGGDEAQHSDAHARDAASRDAVAPDAPPPDGSGPACLLCNEVDRAGFTSRGTSYGRGASWTDVDGDGWEDLWQSDAGTGYEGYDGSSVLWRNRTDGTFEPMDLGIDAADMLANWTGIWGDPDADGDPDLLLVNGGYGREATLAFYRNDLAGGGGFADATADAGISADMSFWWGAAFADFDADGALDLVVTRRLGDAALYRGRGDGTFEPAGDVGVQVPKGDAKNPVWFDPDADGDLDLYVASTDAHRFFRNDGAGAFDDATAALPEFPDGNVAVFAAAAADFDQDGIDDLYAGRWHLQDYVLLSDGEGGFAALGPEIGLDMATFPETDENTMGLQVGDLDGDGWPDVLVGPGRPTEAAPAIVYCHEGLPLGFRRCSEDVVAGHGASRNHGVALADPDHDGDTDFFWNLGGHPNYDLQTGGDTRDLPAFYVRHPPEPPKTAVVHLVGAGANRPAIGARIRVDGGETRYVTHHGANGFPAQSSDWLVVSLSGSDAGAVTVRWPSGAESSLKVAAGDRVEIVEGAP